MLDFGKIIIYTSNLRVIRAPPPRPQTTPPRHQTPSLKPQAPPPPSTFSQPRPRERKGRKGGVARDGEERRSCHTESEVKGPCWVLVRVWLWWWWCCCCRYVVSHPDDCSSSRCAIAVRVQAPPPALSVMAASCPCWPIAATALLASCAAMPASPTVWRPAPAAAPGPACSWRHLLHLVLLQAQPVAKAHLPHL